MCGKWLGPLAVTGKAPRDLAAFLRRLTCWWRVGLRPGSPCHPRNGHFRLHPTLGAAADAPSTACTQLFARRMWTRGVAPPRTAPEDTFLSVRRSEAVSARDREPLLVPNKRDMVSVPHARHAHTHPPRRAGAQYRAGYGRGPLESALRQSREQPPERSWPTRMWPLTGFRPPDIVGSRRGSNPWVANHL